MFESLVLFLLGSVDRLWVVPDQGNLGLLMGLEKFQSSFFYVETVVTKKRVLFETAKTSTVQLSTQMQLPIEGYI